MSTGEGVLPSAEGSGVHGVDVHARAESPESLSRKEDGARDRFSSALEAARAVTNLAAVVQERQRLSDGRIVDDIQEAQFRVQETGSVSLDDADQYVNPAIEEVRSWRDKLASQGTESQELERKVVIESSPIGPAEVAALYRLGFFAKESSDIANEIRRDIDTGVHGGLLEIIQARVDQLERVGQAPQGMENRQKEAAILKELEIKVRDYARATQERMDLFNHGTAYPRRVLGEMTERVAEYTRQMEKTESKK